jgi:hypothetical protein
MRLVACDSDSYTAQVRRDDYPRWMRITGDVRRLVLCAVLVAVGVQYIVLGHAAGELIGVGLVVIGALVALRIVLRPFAKRFAKPS